MLEYLFKPYENYSNAAIYLEVIAVIFGLASVVFASKNNILVYPTGIISTFIYVYLLYNWALMGDMLINIYYSIMSIYGWYLWSSKDDKLQVFPISVTNRLEWYKAGVLFFATISFVVLVYLFFNKFTHWSAYVDTFTTGIFFVGMWLMAKRKLEHWILWIVGDLISIPLYFYKGYTLTSLQYLIFTGIAIYGLIEWKKIVNNDKQRL